jgi:tetratricopeptide (TPR) repeat protein
VLEERLAALRARLRRIADTGDPSPALEPQALTEARQLTELLHADSDDLAVRYALGWHHFHRYLALPDNQGSTDLVAAVEAFMPCFIAGTSGLPEPLLLRLADTAMPQASRLLRQALDSAAPDLLSAAVDLWQRSVRVTPADHPYRATRLNDLGIALRIRFERSGDPTDLDQAIANAQEAVRTTPADHPNPKRLNNLGIALRIRFERSGDPTDLDQAVANTQEAVRTTPADHPDRAGYLSTLGDALRVRFGRSGDPTDLDQAVANGQEAVRTTPADHPNRALYLNNLGGALRDRFERTGGQTDLDQAVAHGQEAIRTTPADHPDRALYLNNLGAALLTRFRRSGDQTDLDQAIDRFQAAVPATPADHPNRAMYLNNLGGALWARFERTGDQTDLDQAVANGEEAVSATPADHPNRAMYLSNLGNVLRVRFWRTGDLPDLDQAIANGEEAAHAIPAHHPDRAMPLSNLGNTLRDRFWRTGDLSDLDQAVDRFRAAVRAAPPDHPHRVTYLNNLGNALRDRFERTGDQTDLDQAVANGEEAVSATPADHPNRAMPLTNLGNALRDRSWRTGDLSDLDQAVDRFRAAVRAAPPDHAYRALYLSNLGGALRDRFGRTGDQTDLDQAIANGEEAVSATPADHPNRAMYLSNLGNALRDRFWRTQDLPDLDQAVDRFRAAVRAAPPDHPDRALYLNNLGGALRDRFGRTGDQTDLDAAVSASTEAWGVVSAPPSFRIQGAWAVVRLVARSETGRAADAAEAAVRLLPEVTLRQLGRGDQQHALGGFAGLAGDAAALALSDPRGTRQERATRALRLLEAGRAVLLSQALDARSDLTDLNRQHPDMAARFIGLRDQLDQPLSTPTPTPTPTPADGNGDTNTFTVRQDLAVNGRHRLARDFARTLAEIRSLDGFTTFALPPTTEELLTQAEQGPVAVFNISPYRSDALLLARDNITHLELPDLTIDALAEKTTSFQQALHTSTSADKSQRKQAQEVITQVLQWLWDTAAGPVLDALGHQRQPPADTDWPQVWWAPGGLLGLLPLHAAGYHTDPADDPHRRTVMDRVISSHTPTVRALRYARQQTRARTPHPDTPAQGLVVAMPTTPGLSRHGRLDYVSAEAEMLLRHLPRTVLLREPDPDGPPADPALNRPTKAAVLGHLPHCPIAHFACHGDSHPTDPSQSRLLLHDHESDPLTVASLIPVRLDHAQLAYLSACRTAAIDIANLADEAIHLTSAFQLAGFPHVVGTLWEIDDQIAVTVADAFYTHLRNPDGSFDTSRAAQALHKAVRSVRDGHDLAGRRDRTRTPFLWAAYLHAGA